MTHNPDQVRQQETVMAFDSLEDMQDWMQTQTMAAMANLLPWQREVVAATDRDIWWLSIRRDFDNLLIVGQAWSDEHNRASEAEAIARIRDEEERRFEEAGLDESMRRMADNRSRGYLFGRAWSVLEAGDGELGDTHVANMTLPLTPGLASLFAGTGYRMTPELARSCKQIASSLIAGATLADLGI